MNVSIKFCGHCAPRTNMMELLDSLKTRMPEISFGYYAPDRPADVLLVLNACQAQCASRPDFSGPTIIVSPETIDYWPTPSDQLCSQLCRRLSELAGGS